MERLPHLTKSFPVLPSPLKEGFLSLPAPTVQGYYVWAEKLFESHRYKEALDAYSECLKLGPSHVDALYKRGLTKGLLEKHGRLSWRFKLSSTATFSQRSPLCCQTVHF